MKTLHTFSAVIILSYSLFSHAENMLSQNNTTLTINIISVSHPSCNGASNGSATAEASGGKTPYSYSWNTYPEQTTSQAVNLREGIYFVQVTDGEGIIYFESVKISDPLKTSSNSAVNIPTENKTVNIEATDNLEKYSCYLDGIKLTESIITGLDIGIHKLVITDNKNCTVVQFIQVMEMEQEIPTDEVATIIETTPLNSLELLQNTEYNASITMHEKK